MSPILLTGAAVVGVLGFLAAWVLAARPGDRSNRAFSAYLTLTAGGVLALAAARAEPVGATTDALFYARMIRWFDLPQFLLVAWVLDEMFLPKPRTRTRAAVLLGLGAFVGAMLVAQVAWPGLYASPGRDGVAPAQVLQFVYAFANDLVHVAAALLAGHVARRPGGTPLLRGQAALVSAGFACLALHAAATALGNLPFQLAGTPSALTPVLDLGSVSNIFGLLALPAVPWLLAPLAGRVRRAVVAALVVAVVLGSTQAGLDWLALQAGSTVLGDVAWGGRLVVWAEVALLLALAVVRFGAAGVSMDARPRLAAATAVVFLGALSAGLFLAGVLGLGATPAGVGLGLVGAAVPPLVLPRKALVGWAGQATDRLLLPPSDPALTRERARIYAAALRGAAAAGGGAPAPDEPELAALRRRLGLGLRDHELLASAMDHRAEALHPGGFLLGRYRILRELGRGGFGEAWLAHDEVDRRDVVLKRLVGDRHRDAEALRRFQRELRLAARVEHPSIVAVHGTEAGPDGAYLVMEYLAGGSLADRLRDRGPLSEAEARAMARDVLAGLGALHARGIVHRDVKPGNILFTADGRAKLGDFTVAREVVSGETEGGDRLPAGTLAYLAPEQARGLPATPRSDLYALGASVHEALTGKPTVDLAGLSDYEAMVRLASAAPPPPVPSASKATTAWLARALARDPAARPASAAAMARELDAPGGAGVTPAGRPAGSARRRRRPPG